MEYLKKDLGSYNLHLIKTKDFKTITVKVNFRSIITKEEITIRNVLTDIITMTSKKYPTKKDLSIASQDLYATEISALTARIGNYLITNISLSVLNDKYTEPGNFKKSIEFLSEIIFNPNVFNNEFSSTTLKIGIDKQLATLNSIKEDPGYYSLIRLFDLLNINPASFRMIGYEEDLNKITPSSIYQYYKYLINNNLIDVFIIGDIDFKETEELIRNNFHFHTFRKAKGSCLVENTSRVKKRTVIEKSDIKQSKLAISLRIGNLSRYERNYVLTLYNIILGAGSDSLLFKKIRKENSLAYSVSSVVNKLDSILIIRAGISKTNFKKVVKLINEALVEMRQAKFTTEDMKKAKEAYKASIDDMLESPSYILESYYMMELIDIDDINKRYEEINKVTKEEIMQISKKIKIELIYLLEGED